MSAVAVETKKIYEGPIAGVTYGHYKFRPDRLKNRDLVIFPDPTNEYDPNAIALKIINGTLALHVGFIPRHRTALLHEVLGRGGRLRCKCTRINFNEDISKQATILVEEILSGTTVVMRRKAKLGLNPVGSRRILL